MNIRKPLSFAVVALLTLPGVNAWAAGFERPDVQQFQLRSPAIALSSESMRTNKNAASSAAAAAARVSGSSANVQSPNNMANVIQVTENYTITLNGDGNMVDTQAGGAQGYQDTVDLNQQADSQVNSSADVDNSSNPYLSNKGDNGGSLVLN